MLDDSPWAFASSPQDDRALDPAQLRSSLANPDFALCAGFRDSTLIASAGILRQEKIKFRHLAMLFGVYVTPSARGCGAGAGVVNAAIETARSWPGVDWVQLGVSERSNEARRLYERLGFFAWGVEPDATRIGTSGYAEIHMRLRL